MNSPVTDWLNQFHCGDAAQLAARLPAESVDTVITSPPYYQQRDYGDSGQLGLESSPEAYIERLVGVFTALRPSLRREGSAAFDKMRLLTAGVRVFGAGARPAPLPEDSARLDDPLAPRPPATAGRTGAGLGGLGSKSSQS